MTIWDEKHPNYLSVVGNAWMREYESGRETPGDSSPLSFHISVHLVSQESTISRTESRRHMPKDERPLVQKKKKMEKMEKQFPYVSAM